MTDFDEYMDFPEDPELAFVEYERRRRDEMWRSVKDAQADESDYVQDQKVLYAIKIIAFHDAHDFSFLEDPKLDRNGEFFDDLFYRFCDNVFKITTEIDIRHARRLKPITMILILTDDIRRQIHNHIQKIRDIIQPIDLKPEKKDSLYAKLNALSDEVDRDRTKAQAWTAFVLELASVGGKVANELEPVKKISDSIGNLLGKAKELSERLGLPSPGETKRLEPPRKELAKRESEEPSSPDDLDEEIPF